MKKILYILFILLFIHINSQKKQNPILLVESTNPFVLSTNNNYYYVITIGYNMKINKESGIIEDKTENHAVVENYIFVSDRQYNNWVYYEKIYYEIIYDPFLSYEEIKIDQNSDYQYLRSVGCISKPDNNIIIYGYYRNDYLIFSSNLGPYSYVVSANIVTYRPICTYIAGEDYICGIINNNNLVLYCLKHHIVSEIDNSQNSLTFYTFSHNSNSNSFPEILSFGLYDTDKDKVKIICGLSSDQIIYCIIIQITVNEQWYYDFLFDGYYTFEISTNFNERNCYFIKFNNEYLLCCALINYIKCSRINTNDYKKIKDFNISIIGENSFLTIKANNNIYATFFFMNNNNKKNVYEYYIYIPTCQNKNYDINKDKDETELGKISNLFPIKTNKYYFEIKDNSNEFGYFTLDNSRINQKILITSDNSILCFKKTKSDISAGISFTINYIVSVEEDEAYMSQCQIKITFNDCYKSCKDCSTDSTNSNDEQHNCINCKDNYYKSPENNNNCYTIEEKKINWYLDIVNSEFYLCDLSCQCSCKDIKTNCLPCPTESDSDNTNEDTETKSTTKASDKIDNIKETNSENIEVKTDKPESDMTISEFKQKINNDIVSNVNPTKVINGKNFLAMILPSDNMDPKEQIKNGISGVDLGNCLNIIKDQNNIERNEDLIIVNIELKNDEDQIFNNDGKSFISGKFSQIEIYDYSGRKLDISVCKEEIKIMKYIGDIDILNINMAEIYSNRGIDVFNAADDFFNDICHPYDIPDNRDIIIDDRRNDIYQNATFCQEGCRYSGVDYSLKVANCLCNSSFLQDVENKMTSNNYEKINFKTITKVFLENIFSFNIKIIPCYKLILNFKYLLHNIGFYCMSSMLVLQIISLFIYIIKKLKSIKIFMMKFGNINNNGRNINVLKIKNIKNNYNKNLENKYKTNPPQKRRYTLNASNRLNKNRRNRNNNRNYPLNKRKIIHEDSNIDSKFKEESFNKLKLQSQSQSFSNSKKNIYTPNYLKNNNNSPNIYNIKNSAKKYTILSKNSEGIKHKDKIMKSLNINKNNYNYDINNNKPDIFIFLQKFIFNKNNKNNGQNYKNNLNRSSQKIYNIQDMSYESAIIHDKRSCIKIYFGYLLDSQIILGTFCGDNRLDLFIIKFSFLVCNFQMNFFLNALFYTDEYISDAYHNNGILDFISGLPKSIYSSVLTLFITDLLKMLSSSRSKLIKIVNNRKKYKNYIFKINQALDKLRKKLIFYFIFIYLFSLSFMYYVVIFCAVYKNSQKYWIFGFLESFGMDTLVAFIICIFTALFRYISIKMRIKYLYIIANIISTFV